MPNYPLASRLENGVLYLNDFAVICPKCGDIRVYTPRTPTTKMKHALFTCKKCKVRSLVIANQAVKKKDIIHGNRNLKVSNKVLQPKKVSGAKRNISPLKCSLWELSNRELLDEFKKFVGYIDEKGNIHRGEAIPEPIDEITGVYMGIADYQLNFILEYRDNHNILMIWARGHGKTWEFTWIIEMCMKYEAERFLYFSLTDVAYTVADWIYIWAQNQQFVVDAETTRANKKISGRKSTYQKFTLINGARYEVHGIRTSSTLGYHGWVIMMDDIIDEQHKRLPHLQRALQMKWDHQYSKIRRKKLVMCNTRKFAGDYFDFIIDQFEKKLVLYEAKKGVKTNKYTLYISHKTPYKNLGYSGGIPGYRKFTKALERNKIAYDDQKVLAPWFHPDDFKAMKAENLKSFFAEMIGNPRPLEGGNWQKEDLKFIPGFEPFDYEAVGIIVDPAWTISETAAQSGITMVGLKLQMRENRRQYTVFKSFGKKLKVKKWKDKKTGKEHDGLLDFVERQFQWMYVYFPHVRYKFVIFELASGGQVMVDIATAEGEIYEFAAYIPEEYEGYPKTDKLDRIDSELFDVIKNQDVDFVDTLEEGGLIFQILTFPDCDYYDQVDALALAISYLRKMKTTDINIGEKRKYMDELKQAREDRRASQYEENYGLASLRKGGSGRGSGRGARY